MRANSVSGGGSKSGKGNLIENKERNSLVLECGTYLRRIARNVGSMRGLRDGVDRLILAGKSVVGAPLYFSPSSPAERKAASFT